MTAVHVDLARLLHRLNTRLLGKDTSPQLSSLEISKLSTNLNYARKLLAQLEVDASGIKNQVQRQRAQAELMQQRHMVRKINETLHDLGRLDDPTVVHVEDAPEPTPASHPSQSYPPPQPVTTAPPPYGDAGSTKDIPPDSPVPQSFSSTEPAQQLFRNRFKRPEPKESSTTTALSTTDSSLDKALTNQRNQQDDLTDSLLSMAKQLRMNSTMFGETLEKEKVHLDDAAQGLEKNTDTMTGTSGKMTQLQSSQSVSFWYQIKVLVAIVGLAFVGLLMLMAPKLRW